MHDSEVWNSVVTLNKPWRLDEQGVCVAALRLVPELTTPLAVLISSLLSSDDGWDSLTVLGYVKGKQRGDISYVQDARSSTAKCAAQYYELGCKGENFSFHRSCQC